MSNLICIICTNLIRASENVRVINCGHLFHYSCLRQWFQRSQTCPQCRNECEEKDTTRIQFPLTNFDVSDVDACGLQEQVDDMKLELHMSDKKIQDDKKLIRNLKLSQFKNAYKINSLEQKIRRALLIDDKNHYEEYKMKMAEAEQLRKENINLKSKIDAMKFITTIIKSPSTEVEKLCKNENNPWKLAFFVEYLERELNDCESQRINLRNNWRIKSNDLRKQREEQKKQSVKISQLEAENEQLSREWQKLISAGPKTNEITRTELSSTSKVAS